VGESHLGVKVTVKAIGDLMSSFGPVVCDGVGQKFSPSPKTDWKEVSSWG
jgi:hypothetical protein